MVTFLKKWDVPEMLAIVAAVILGVGLVLYFVLKHLGGLFMGG